MKAIETNYKGYLFRSRLEAKWAVFFDALGSPWDYEKEGFEFEGGRYLPDFWLPKQRLWVEIKPKALDEIHPDLLKLSSFAAALRGRPGPYCRFRIFSGDPVQYQVQTFLRSNDSTQLCSEEEAWTDCPLCRQLDFTTFWQCCQSPDEWAIFCEHCDVGCNNVPDGETCFVCDARIAAKLQPNALGNFHKGDVCAPRVNCFLTSRINEAAQVARSARFEHGDRPRF